MCIFGGGGSAPAPQPLPPAPPPPLPPVQPVPPPDPVIQDVNANVSTKKKAGNKLKNQYSKGTGSLRIKLNPKINTGTDAGAGGGLN